MGQQWVEQPAPDMEMAADLDVLQHREILEKLHELECPDETAGRDALRRQPRDILVVEKDAAGTRCIETRDDVEESCLPSAVWPDDRGNPARGDSERNIFERNQPAETARNAV
jgi:hypothetical protein